MMYLAILMFAVFFAGFAMTVNEGLWNNAITLLCVILAAMIAVPGGLMLSAYVIEQAEPSPENAWAFKFASLWGVYFAAVMILRLVTDRLSRVRVRFFKPLDAGGGILLGLVVSLMLTSFAALMLFIPFAAGVWKTADAPGWQTTTIQSFASPMSSAITAFHGESAREQITSR
jgi:uncharacterized membrane protein required for colicin V production